MGKTAVLQAKRVDVESQGTLAMASLKCSRGQEDELLAQMSDLAPLGPSRIPPFLGS